MVVSAIICIAVVATANPTVSQIKTEILIGALRVTKADVKVIEDGVPTRKVSPEQAVLIARSGNFEGSGSPKRVRCIRRIDNRRPMIFDHAFQDDRAVIKFWSDQRSSGGHSQAA